MTKYIIAAFLIACCFTQATAQDCKLDVDKTDPFTKEHVRSNTMQVAPKNYHWTLTLEQRNDKYFWGMEIKYSGHYPDAFGPDKKIMFSTEGGDVVEMIPDKDYAPAHRAFDDGFIITTYNVKGPLAVEDLKKFQKSLANGIRVPIGGKDVEPKLSSKQGEAIQKTVSCLLK